MRAFITILFLFLIFGCITGQSEVMETNDPAATRILDQIKADYDNLESIQLEFKLTMAFPEEGEEVQVGTMIQKGNQYKVDTKQQTIYSNGETVWMYIKGINEVQIDHVRADQAEMMSPKQIMSFYEKGDFIYLLTGESIKNGTIYHNIEFKPVDKDSEYSKMRVIVRKKDNQLEEIIVFSKDGSRFKLEIQNVKKNQKYNRNIFIFEPSMYPGIHIEDLRID